jgi:uncharacterized protein (DUF2235 family)
MVKRIVVCFDGTWNTPSEQYVGLKALHEHFDRLAGKSDDDVRMAVETVTSDPGVETNVCRLYRSVKRVLSAEVQPGQIAQTKWYDAGVGTKWYDRIPGGAVGLGLSKNLREGYQFLSKDHLNKFQFEDCLELS